MYDVMPTNSADEPNLYADMLGASGLTRYYWVRGVNTRGTPGALSAVASATTGQVTNAVPADGSVTAVKTSLNAINASTGDLVADSVTAVQIAAGAVSTTELAANAITAGSGKIATAAIDTLLIANNAVILPVVSKLTGPSSSGFSHTNGSTHTWDFHSLAITVPTEAVGQKLIFFAQLETKLSSNGEDMLYQDAHDLTLMRGATEVDSNSRITAIEPDYGWDSTETVKSIPTGVYRRQFFTMTDDAVSGATTYYLRWRSQIGASGLNQTVTRYVQRVVFIAMLAKR